jgi:hypothetical protein
LHDLERYAPRQSWELNPPTFIPWYKNDRMIQHHARLLTSPLPFSPATRRKKKKRCLANFRNSPSQS